MRTLVLMLLLLSAALAVHPVSVKHMSTKALRDLPTIPGLDQAFCHGVDRKDLKVRGPIFSYAYTKGQTWTNPVDGKTYLVPDNVNVIATPTSYMHQSTYLLANMTQVQDMHKQWSNWHFGIPGWFIDFDYQSMVMHLKEELLQKTHVVYMSEIQFTYYRMQTWPHSTLNDQGNSHFSRLLNNLPAQCNTQAEKRAYWSFREAFGTDYSPEADFGGTLTMYQVVDQVLYKKHTEDWVYHQVSLSFQWAYFKLGLNFGRNSSEFKFDQEFKDHMKYIFEWGGGNVTTNITDYKTWEEKVIVNPVAVHPRLVPLTQLITDPAKRACLEAEIDNYMKDPSPPTSFNKREVEETVWGRSTKEIVLRENGGEMKLHLPASTSEISAPVLKKLPDTAGVHNAPVYRPQGVALPFPPAFGTDSIGYGYDAVSGLRRALPLIDQTYTKGHTWTNPFDQSQTYAVNDQVQIMDVPSSWISNMTEGYSTFQDYQHSEQHSTKKGGFLGFGSRKTTTYTFVEKSYKEDYSHTQYDERYGWYRVSIPPLPPPRLSPQFTTALAALPKTYTKADQRILEAYMEFLGLFGTHYLTQGIIGGAASQATWFHSCFTKTMDATWVTKQSGWSFIIISHNKGSQDAHTKIDANWWQYSDTSLRLVGGSTMAYTNTDLPEWRKTVAKNMTPIEFVIEPISDLVSDPTMKANLLAAITDFMQGGQTKLNQYAAQLDTKEPHTKPDWCKMPTL